ncbi:hypothetical protein GPJ56_004204 [Histomonas meleagridis]|uniref:uncharacterized protein n=1 Tax=Histomonas meleagridis TaxID=135588 RepID=UPI003559F533|nr:hypothetical protein GPJ56_004204 [Histomonas meleagridis]KAH0802247.1 hypothetical protein GO595_004860 [Histomonas meleagridis]
MKHSTLKIPQQIDFGFCPVGETTSQEITVTNLSRDSTTFIWLSKDPFKISPQHGTILGKKQQQFRVDFLPDIATRFNGTLVCRYGTELLEKSIIEVNGISKIPHITLSTNFIDFGRIPSSAKSIQTITVHNSAPVPATVTITSDFPQFIVQPTVIHLKPEGSSLVKILFHPTNFDFFAFANITFSTAGGNSATTRCRAYVTGPTVTIDRTTLSLGSVHLKSTSSNIFNISNHSDRRILFQFLIEPTSVFRFDPIQGILPPNYSKAIRVTFSPQHPIVYHRRVILVIHQHHPMAIDVFGSAFDTFNHPPKIKTSSVEKYYQAIAQGLGSKPPRAIKEFTPIQIPEIDYISNDLKRNLCTLNSGVHIFDELFIQKDLVTISPNHFDFGACQRDISPEPKTLTVKNNTDSALTLFWEKNSDGFVNVEPEISEIPKNQKVDIIVKFNPLLEFQFMGTMLEGFAQFKEMRNSNIVNFITLPFVLTPFCNGHTMDDVTSFIPTMYTSHKTLIFSGAIIGDSKYQTFYVENRGDCAFKFDIRIIDPEKPDKDSLNSSSTAFNVYPRIGTIDKGSFQIFVVKFNPTQKGHYHSQIFATINDSPLNFFNLNLKGDSSIPTIKYSVNGTLFLHPISLGSFSNQIIQIFNESTIPIKIEWKIPTIYNRLLMVKPNSIEVRSKEVIDCEWIFHPNTIGEFKAEVICNVQSLVNSSNTYISKDFLPFIIGKENIHIENSLMNTLKSVQHYPLTISTLVTDCIIDSKPKEIDFGYVRINSISSSTLIITNHSDSQMKFVLRTKSRNSKIVMFNPSKDILPARSSREIEIRFQPNSSGLITDSIIEANLFSSHIGKREENVLEDENQNVICQFCQFIDVVFDAITENDYRNEFGSVDTFYFDVQNPKNVNEKYKDEIGGLLMNVFNEALADEQLRKYAMKNAEIRQKNIPYFQQLYKEDENVSVENVKVNETKIADDVQSFLRDVIDEIVDEACEGKFSLENEIVQISGFKTNK